MLPIVDNGDLWKSYTNHTLKPYSQADLINCHPLSSVTLGPLRREGKPNLPGTLREVGGMPSTSKVKAAPCRRTEKYACLKST